MDFIDPDKQRRHSRRLIIGYVLIAVAIALTTLVLLFLSYGYGFGKNGQVIQNGLVFVSSTPNPAKIYLNGVLNSSTTNSRLQLPAGQYTLKLVRSGYRPWVRSLGVEGGSVENFDYPFLFPTKIVTTNVQQYSSLPGLLTQSPDQHWLLIQQPGSNTNFYEYDLSNQKQVTSSLTNIGVPTSLVTSTPGAQSWQLVDWADDNQHVLLQHSYQGGSEYILLDRKTPSDSVNLTRSLNLSPSTQLTLDNKKYDQYYLFDTATKTVSTATLSNTQPDVVLSAVADFKSYGNNTLLYVTAKDAPAGEVNVDIWQSGKNYVLQKLPTDSLYLLNLTQYGGDWYVAYGASSEGKVYVYENPIQQIQTQNQSGLPLIPSYILKVNKPDYLSFSDNAQFIVAESGASFAVYDAENQKGYVYNAPVTVPAGQHGSWMDGDRLVLTANGHLVVFDYDGANLQTLEPAVDGALPFFDPSYKWLYALAPATQPSSADQFDLTSTALRIPADQ